MGMDAVSSWPRSFQSLIVSKAESWEQKVSGAHAVILAISFRQGMDITVCHFAARRRISLHSPRPRPVHNQTYSKQRSK